MQHRITRVFAIGAAAVAMACSRQHVGGTTPMTNSSGGDVVTRDVGGLWLDSSGGTWLDGSGRISMGRHGQDMELQPATISSMSNSNIVAHLVTGDSLEAMISQIGVDRAQSAAVRDFARRMVLEHTGHLQLGRQVAAQNSLALALAAADTDDAMIATRMMYRLSGAPDNSLYDRQVMRAEVMLHRHMLHDLNAVRPQATGAVQQLIDQTIPVVRHHLAEAEALWAKEGGGSNNVRAGNGWEY